MKKIILKKFKYIYILNYLLYLSNKLFIKIFLSVFVIVWFCRWSLLMVFADESLEWLKW